MRIAIVHPDLVSNKGVERYTLELARSLCAEHEVHVFANRCENLPKGVRLHKVWAAPRPYFLRLLTFALNASRKLRQDSFDLVSVQGCCALTADVVTAHSCHRAWWQLRKQLPWAARLRKRLNPFHYVALTISHRLFTSRCTRWVIAVSHGTAQEIHNLYNFPLERILVRPPGVDRHYFHPAKRARYREDVRTKFCFSQDDFVLLFVGNEFYRKGLDLVLQAMALIREPRLKLLVAGAANAIAYWQSRRLARRLCVEVRFARRLRDMARIYAAADALILPSLYEAFPAVVLEAAASGLPLLASRCNGICDVLNDGDNGWYIERDAADIAAKITALMKDPQRLSRMGAAARASTERYDAERARSSLLSTYSMLSDGGPVSPAQDRMLSEPRPWTQSNVLPSVR